MTRIIGGVAGGRTLATPRGPATRPTSDRVREALFSMLAARDRIVGARVLDLYAGSGALGLEAASRGAEAVTLVEQDRPTARLISANARTLGLAVEVVTAPVRAFARRGAGAGAGEGSAYDLVLADPPYPLSEDELAADLVALAEGGRFAPDALLVLERSIRSPEPRWPAGLAPAQHRSYGDTALWFADALLGCPPDDYVPERQEQQ